MAIEIQGALSRQAPRNGAFYAIAVDGRGGSGKTLLANCLKQLLPGFAVLNGDDYFEPTPGELAWGDFNEGRFDADVIQPLRLGATTLAYRAYDWAADPPIRDRQVSVAGGFCLERCFSFALELDWDLKLWVETPKAVCLARGLAREHLPAERVRRVWEEIWQPREDEYISKERPQEIADFVIDGTRPLDAQITA